MRNRLELSYFCEEMGRKVYENIDFIFGFEYRENFMAKQLLAPIRRQTPWHPVVGLGGHTLNAAASCDDEPHIQGGIGELLLGKL